MELRPYLRHDLVFHLDRVSSRDELFAVICRGVEATLPEVSANSLHQRLLDREKQMPTCTPDGVAFPHAVGPEIPDTVVVIVYVVNGVDFGVSEHPPSDLILGMFGSSEKPWEHVRLLARLARIVHTEASRENLRAARDAEDLFRRLVEEDRSHE
jgi:mannitol/fructose-specific phosphotransferase system IIA component (Ntr-type)